MANRAIGPHFIEPRNVHNARSEEAPKAPAKITLLYESRDGKLCLFEDAGGHLFAIRSERLV